MKPNRKTLSEGYQDWIEYVTSTFKTLLRMNDRVPLWKIWSDAISKEREYLRWAGALAELSPLFATLHLILDNRRIVHFLMCETPLFQNSSSESNCHIPEPRANEQ